MVQHQTQPPASVLMAHNHRPSMLQLLQLLLLFLNNNLSVLMVLHLTQPPASVLMVHNHKPSMLQLLQLLLLFLNNNLSVLMVPAPDPTTGLCADGSQPQAFNATAAPTTAPVPEQQLVCS